MNVNVSRVYLNVLVSSPSMFFLFLQANHDSPNPPLVHSPIHQSDLDVDEDDMQDVEIIEFLSTDDEGQSQESEEDQAEARWMILRCFKN
jgi:hypothetical protein